MDTTAEEFTDLLNRHHFERFDFAVGYATVDTIMYYFIAELPEPNTHDYFFI